MQPRFQVGYTTGTFDTLHHGHLELLRRIKEQCVSLTIGLTCDELAVVQKRPPVFTYHHRRDLLLGTKYVDRVVPHTGRTKQADHDELKFDALFIGNDYEHSPEYTVFSQQNPSIPVIFLPRTPGVCSTTILERVSPVVFAYGIQGPVFRCGEHVVKYIPIRRLEWKNTADVYHLPIPRPRNWKQTGQDFQYNNIPGVNCMREIHVAEVLKDFLWFTTCHGEYVWCKGTEHRPRETTSHDDDDKRTELARRQPNNWELCRAHDDIVAVFKLTQRHGGRTLMTWWPTASIDERKRVWEALESVLMDLFKVRVVHGDLHANNICVNNQCLVSVLDFGWCTSDRFDMTIEEQELHNTQLKEGFDRQHLLDSLAFDGLDTTGVI